MAKKRNKKSIKDFLPPDPNAKTLQNFYRPIRPAKYHGDPNKIIYRSSWEYMFLRWCDESEHVIKYASEPIGIPYYNPITKRKQRYFIDFWMITRDKKGRERKWLIEVKPHKFTQPPEKQDGRLTEKKFRQYTYHAKQFIMNQAKFKAARHFCEENGYKFGVITEHFFKKRGLL